MGHIELLKKSIAKDGAWKYKRITLTPDNKDFKEIVLEGGGEDDFRVVAETNSQWGGVSQQNRGKEAKSS